VKRHAREALPVPPYDLVPDDLRPINACDIVLIETLCQGAMREGIVDRLSSALRGVGMAAASRHKLRSDSA